VIKEPFAVIKKRGSSWWVVIYAGRDPLTGRKRQKTGTAETRAEARQLEARLITEAATGRHRSAGTKTVADLLEAWYQWRPGARPISPNTLANYRRYMDQKILPALGKVPVGRLDAAMLDRFYSELRQRGSMCQHCYRRMRGGEPPMRQGEAFRLRFTGKEVVHETDCVQGLPMSASALRDVHAILSGAFKQAMRWGWITQNPVPMATAPATEQADVRPPDVKQVERLLDTATAEDPELGLFLRLAVVLGARRGEVCSLRWSEVDLDRGEVLVAGSVIILAGQPLLDRETTKTRTKRRVAVGEGTLALLRLHRAAQAETALACGNTLAPDAYVFSRAADASTPIRPDGVTHRFTKLARRLGVSCRLHDLRHFMVTQLISAGVDVRTVAGRAGHADGGRITLGTYAHFQQAQDRQAADLMDGLLAPAATKSRSK
jgi:integrase